MKRTENSGFTPKVTSHAEMTQNPRLHNRHTAKGLQTPYEMDSVEQEVVNGVVLKKSALRTYDPVENFRGYKASDFALENIIAVGALDSLRESKLSYGSASEISDGLEGSIDNIINAVDEAEASSQTVGGNG